MFGERPWSRLTTAVVSAVYVPTCAWCGRRGWWVCETCLPTVDPIMHFGCSRCGVIDPVCCECAFLPPEIDRLRSVYPFEGWVRSAIHKFKFEREHARAESLAACFEHVPGLFHGVEAIVAVPMHRDRLRVRGFNQAELLAKFVAAQNNIDLISPLERVLDRGSQVGRSLPDRWLAVDGSFACTDSGLIQGRRVAVFDDVITTGATVSSCARELVAAGAAQVIGVSLARG